MKPYLDGTMHGIYATRHPTKLNHIGLSIVKLNGNEDNIIFIENVDVINSTPLLDIKPYVPEFDSYTSALSGWLNKKI